MHRGRRDSPCQLLWAEYGHEDADPLFFSAAFAGTEGRRMDGLRFFVHSGGYSSEKTESSGCQSGRLSGVSQHWRLFCDGRDLSVLKPQDAEDLAVQRSGRRLPSKRRAGDMEGKYMERE